MYQSPVPFDEGGYLGGHAALRWTRHRPHSHAVYLALCSNAHRCCPLFYASDFNAWNRLRFDITMSGDQYELDNSCSRVAKDEFLLSSSLLTKWNE